MKLDSNPTTTVTKDQAQPNWAEIGLWLSVLVSVLIGWALWNGVFSEAWTNYLDPKNIDPVPRTEALRNLTWSMGTIGAVFAGFIGLVMAGFRTVALHRQSKTAQRESDLNAQKHQSEVFATAIEQLGHDNFAVRLGAVYALEALAKSAQDLHGLIFETLCAYIRQEAPAPTDDDLSAKITAHDEADINDIIDKHLKSISKPDVVIQAILTVIGRRNPTRDPEDFHLDLRETDMRQCDLRKGHFENTLFIATHLAGADLGETRLKGADLGNAHLEGADLMETDLEDTHLLNAHLEGVFLRKAHLKGADLMFAYLEDAHLAEANLEGASLWYVSFNRLTNVRGANLRDAQSIPARAARDFRATVDGDDQTQWPDDDDQEAWDRDD